MGHLETMNRFYALPLIPVFFALLSCVVAAEPSSTPAPKSETGLEGVISTSPPHGGPIRQGEPESKPLPHMDFVVKQDDRTVATFKTDEQGRFRIPLAPGHYTVTAADQKGTVGNYGPFPVEITAEDDPGQVGLRQRNALAPLRTLPPRSPSFFTSCASFPASNPAALCTSGTISA